MEKNMEQVMAYRAEKAGFASVEEYKKALQFKQAKGDAMGALPAIRHKIAKLERELAAYKRKEAKLAAFLAKCEEQEIEG